MAPQFHQEEIAEGQDARRPASCSASAHRPHPDGPEESVGTVVAAGGAQEGAVQRANGRRARLGLAARVRRTGSATTRSGHFVNFVHFLARQRRWRLDATAADAHRRRPRTAVLNHFLAAVFPLHRMSCH